MCFPKILRRCGGACRDEVAPFKSYIILLRYRGGAAASIVEAREGIVPGTRVQMGRPRLATPLCTPSRHLPRHPPHGDLLRDPSRKFRAILHLRPTQNRHLWRSHIHVRDRRRTDGGQTPYVKGGKSNLANDIHCGSTCASADGARDRSRGAEPP